MDCRLNVVSSGERRQDLLNKIRAIQKKIVCSVTYYDFTDTLGIYNAENFKRFMNEEIHRECDYSSVIWLPNDGIIREYDFFADLINKGYIGKKVLVTNGLNNDQLGRYSQNSTIDVTIGESFPTSVDAKRVFMD